MCKENYFTSFLRRFHKKIAQTEEKMVRITETGKNVQVTRK